MIFRKSELVQHALETWKETVERRRASQALSQYSQAERVLSDWRTNRQTKLRPHQREVEQFLWLM